MSLNRKEILAQYLKVDQSKLSFIGSGHFAQVYLYKNKVYKVTRDIDDYLMATKLIKQGKKYDCFVKVYKTRIFDIKDGGLTERLYLIVSEYVTPLENSNDRKACEIWDTIESWCDTRDFLIDGKPMEFPPILDHSQLADHLFSEFTRILELYRKWGMKFWDCPTRNLAYIDGKIKIFDFGFSALKKAEEYKYSKRRIVTFKTNKTIEMTMKEQTILEKLLECIIENNIML